MCPSKQKHNPEVKVILGLQKCEGAFKQFNK